MSSTAIYARYSSENQRETSIDDQKRECKKYADSNGLSVTAEYADMEMSGRLDERPQYKKLMADAIKGCFDTLLVHDLSRLSRGTNTSSLIEEFKFHGIRFISISDGIDSSQKGSKLQIGMKAMMNNNYLDQLKENVHRGLEGKALKGHNAGGRSYGYNHVPHFSDTRFDIYGRAEIDYVTRELNEDQSKWIRQIFEWVAEGRAYHWIAEKLNLQGITTLNGGSWTASTICGGGKNPHSGILNNPLYIGIYYWNRTEKVYSPSTGKARTRWRDEKDWIKVELPDLRIVSDELWSAVKARQNMKRASTKIKRGELHHNARTGPGPKFILSGLLICAECGGKFVITSTGKYKCSNAHRRGAAICTTTECLPKTEIEEILLKSLRIDLFTTEAMDVFKSEIAALLKKRKTEYEPTIRQIKNQVKDVDTRISNLIDAIETGATESSVLSSRLSELVIKKEKLERELHLQNSYIQDIEPLIPRALDKYREVVANLPEACKSDAAPIREKLSLLLGGQVVLRKSEHGGWEGTYRGSYSGMIRLGISHREISDETLMRRWFVLAATAIMPRANWNASPPAGVCAPSRHR
jgi:DNA invertase Pin-like site-specific DNA recombinase